MTALCEMNVKNEMLEPYRFEGKLRKIVIDSKSARGRSWMTLMGTFTSVRPKSKKIFLIAKKLLPPSVAHKAIACSHTLFGKRI